MMRATSRLLNILVFISLWIIVSTVTFPYLSHNICIQNELFREPHIFAQLVEVQEAYARAGLQFNYSCKSATSILLDAKEVLAEEGIVGSTYPGGQVQVYNGQQWFLPLLTNVPRKITIQEEAINSGHVFQLILVHEIGHTLGIAHNIDSKNIMFPYITNTDLTLDQAVEQVKEQSYVKF